MSSVLPAPVYSLNIAAAAAIAAAVIYLACNSREIAKAMARNGMNTAVNECWIAWAKNYKNDE